MTLSAETAHYANNRYTQNRWRRSGINLEVVWGDDPFNPPLILFCFLPSLVDSPGGPAPPLLNSLMQFIQSIMAGDTFRLGLDDWLLRAWTADPGRVSALADSRTDTIDNRIAPRQ